MNLEAAAAYARKHALQALLVAEGNEISVHEFASGFSAESAHPLYSGTKSFWGVAAHYAQSDGLLRLDEPVAQTIDAWQQDPWKRRVTLRMLLSLTSGFGFGGLGSAVPAYDRALTLPLRNEPGTAFTYGGIPLQVFGAVFARKLAPRGQTPQEYLRRRVLDPAGVEVASWRTLADGTQPLPTGASLRARDWLAYGRFVAREREALAECFRGSIVNPRYGLGWWLGAAGLSEKVFYASGAGGQAMYVIPSRAAVVVRFGKSASYKHDPFLRRLLS
ncbi:MAG: beta-lactamase family protein [Candidatus Eremiobacteraeota bacterium]|nr:beta-lactamase family protein [Candidatus Eremiobacteraeota bacterium]